MTPDEAIELLRLQTARELLVVDASDVMSKVHLVTNEHCAGFQMS